jgi:cathepsin L
MEIDHVVGLVGYGHDAELDMDYWLVRNSWSPSWGEQGYIRLKRDPVDATPCGVDNTPLDGTGCDGGPDVQYPCGQCGVVFDVSFPTGCFSA